MYWPRLRLTPEEEKFLGKYYDPRTQKRGVLRRMYPGWLTLTESQRQPVFPFQLARRCRVFGITISGDVERFKLSIIDATGEQRTAVPMYLSHLFTGMNQLPIGLIGGGPVTSSMEVPGFTPVPCIFEPNIVLLPNQTLRFEGFEVLAFQDDDPDFRIDFTIHVWEFPGMEGSPV